ncbi:MAG: metallophosphoesterase, partial [Marinilabiliaceae bacterium]|nr:metallophosphoesterase [Marinilabiliaceae bacterium]
MKRRNFLSTLISANLGIFVSGKPSGGFLKKSQKDVFKNGTVSVDDNIISFYLEDLDEPLKIIQVSDTHLWMDDMRGKAFSEYSQRMAGAYNSVKHFRTGEDTDPQKSFGEVLEIAVKKNADLLAMTGDIFSFPSEAAIEWLYNKVNSAGIPYLYTAGNHDWHYEGMEGSRQELRKVWTEKRLKPLYQGNNPLMASYI